MLLLSRVDNQKGEDTNNNSKKVPNKNNTAVAFISRLNMTVAAEMLTSPLMVIFTGPATLQCNEKILLYNYFPRGH